MEILSQIDLRSVFVPSLHLTEIWLRGTLVYLLLFTVLRVLRLEAGYNCLAALNIRGAQKNDPTVSAENRST